MTERELFAAHGVTWWHCSGLVRRDALRTPCKAKAIRIWVREDGVRVGLCYEHRNELSNEAAVRGWQPVFIDESVEFSASVDHPRGFDVEDVTEHADGPHNPQRVPKTWAQLVDRAVAGNVALRDIGQAYQAPTDTPEGAP
jgi:hypothetical protein